MFFENFYGVYIQGFFVFWGVEGVTHAGNACSIQGVAARGNTCLGLTINAGKCTFNR